MSSSPTEATLIDVTMPQMGVSVAEGTVVEWRKQPGDWVQRDEVICAISTDKIDTDVEAPASGRVHELVVHPGETVAVGTVMARIATDARPGEAHVSERDAPPTGEAAAALEAPGEAGELQGDTAAVHDDASAQRPQPRRPAGARRYSPVVQRIAAEHGIDLDGVSGTGRGGRVRKQDVLALVQDGGAAVAAEPPMHIESPYRPDPPAAAAPGGVIESGPLSRVRQSIGRHMVESLRTAATCTSVIEADMSRVATARAQSGLTWLPYVARATVEALRAHPALNATLEGETTLTRYGAVHLGIAVSLGDDGLIVPVDPRRPGPLRRGPGRTHPRAGAAGARRRADPGRGPRRHLHDHQPGRGGHDHGHPGHQPAAGGDPRHRGGRQAPGGRHRRGRPGRDRHPPHDLSVHVLGSPGARRHGRRRLPGDAARAARALAGRLTLS